jgi:hypothetical protein
MIYSKREKFEVQSLVSDWVVPVSVAKDFNSWSFQLGVLMGALAQNANRDEYDKNIKMYPNIDFRKTINTSWFHPGLHVDPKSVRYTGGPDYKIHLNGVSGKNEHVLNKARTYNLGSIVSVEYKESMPDYERLVNSVCYINTTLQHMLGAKAGRYTFGRCSNGIACQEFRPDYFMYIDLEKGKQCKACLEFLERNDKNRKLRGYLYIIGDKKHNLYKIGASKNPPDRMSFAENTCPLPAASLSILYQVDTVINKFTIEGLTHRKFDKYRLSIPGEWFLLPGNIYDDFVNSLESKNV